MSVQSLAGWRNRPRRIEKESAFWTRWVLSYSSGLTHATVGVSGPALIIHPNNFLSSLSGSARGFLFEERFLESLWCRPQAATKLWHEKFIPGMKKEIQWESIIIDALKREGRKDTGFVLHFGREWCMATKQNSFIKQIFSPWMQNTNCMLLSSSHSGMKVKNADTGWLALGAISHSWCICLILCVFEGPLLRTCMQGCSF